MLHGYAVAPQTVTMRAVAGLEKRGAEVCGKITEAALRSRRMESEGRACHITKSISLADRRGFDMHGLLAIIIIYQQTYQFFD